MQTKKQFKLALWGTAGFLFVLGIMQMIAYLSGQLTAIQQAEAQGVAAQQISQFFWHQVMPQLLDYVMQLAAFEGVLYLLGMISKKIDSEKARPKDPSQWLPSSRQEKELDTLFEEFEIVEHP